MSLAVTQAVRFVTTVFLARLLTPELFGLVGMAGISITLLSIFRQLGFSAAFIQRKDADAGDAGLAASTTFWLGLGLNSTVFLIAFAVAPLVADFFQTEGLLPVLRAMFVFFLLDGLDMTPAAVLQKDLEFGKKAVAEIASGAANAVIAIPMAVAGFGVWSLVGGQLGSRVIRMIFLYRLSGWRPRLEFSWPIAKQLIGFGKYMWGFSALSAVGDNLDRVIIGRWIGSAGLGIYELAFNLAKLPTTHISRLINQITFPSFSKIQDDKALLQRAFHKTLSHVSLVAIPTSAGLLATSQSLVLTMYGEQWTGVIPLLGVLAFYGLFLSISSTVGPVLMATGRPKLLFYTGVVHHSTLVLLLIWLGRFGLLGIAWAVVVPMALSACVAFVMVIRILDLRVWRVMEPIVRPALAAGIMYLAVTAVGSQLPVLTDLEAAPGLLAQVVVGVGTYVGSCYIVYREGAVDFIKTLRNVLASRGDLV